MNKKGRFKKRLFALLILLCLVLGGVKNLPLVGEAAATVGTKELSRTVREVRGALTEGVFGKHFFVELGGAYARLLGRRAYHGVSVLQNGMLDHEALPRLDTAPLERAIVKLKQETEEKGNFFLFVQVPCKMDNGGTLMTSGQVHFGRENADALLLGLKEQRTRVLDLRDRLTRDRASVERYFYRTDHHWNTDGAFLASKMLLSELSGASPVPMDQSTLDEALWERKVYPDWFLGSHGKRVGRVFGGIDDLIVYTPKFDTEMTLEIPLHGVTRQGRFEDTVLRREYLDASDYFGENPYVSYIGGDYPLVKHRNPSASNALSVLLIKDSFALPVEAFLSVAVERLDVIDPRYDREGSVAEYIRDGNYDAVVMMINPSVFGDESYLKIS